MTISIESRIDSVRLYRTGAVVTRLASVPSGAPSDEVRVAGLPLALEDSTLRIVPHGGASLSQVRLGIDVVEPPAGGEPIDEQAARALERDEASLRAELAVLGRARSVIDKLALPRRALRSDAATPPADAKSRAAFLRLRAERLGALFAEEHKLAVELARVVKRRASLSDALAKTIGSRPPDPMSLRKSAAFQLKRSGAGAIDVELSYFVPGARWAPAYALRIDQKTSRALLELSASVCQSTGEDWTNVAISLSTAEAMRFHELQELTSLRIGRAQAPRKRSFRLLDDPRELFADFDRAFGQRRGAPAPELAKDDELDEVTDVGRDAPPPAQGMRTSFTGAPAAFAPPQQQMAMAMPMAPPASMGAPDRSRAYIALDARVPPPRKGGGSPWFGGGGAPPAFFEDGALGEPEPDAEPQLELDGRMFAFESLRMPPPAAQKGRLGLVSPMEAYLETSRSLQPSRAGQIGAVLANLRQASERALATDPPRRHVLPNAESGFHQLLRGEHRVDVPADGAFHSLPVMQAQAPLATRHVAVPRETSDVFRLANFRNPLGAPLLAGPCDVYVDDDFLLTVDMPTVPVAGDARVGLGVDQAIKIARNTHFSEQTQGLMGGSLLLKHRIEIEIVSHLGFVASLEVRERVPSAHEKDEDIKIDVGEVSPPWQRWEAPANEPSVRGAFAWRVELEPQKPIELSASYTIRIPSKLELVGGNRRD